MMENVMKLRRTLSTTVFALYITLAYCQDFAQTDTTLTQTEKKFQDRQNFIGSSFFVLGNLDTKEPPAYFQLNYGYRLSPKNSIIVEAITWTYYRPLGITYGSTGESYPGKIRAYGIGAGYQHFYWKNLYSTLQITPFLQHFFDSDDEKIQSGFQLWCQFRVGYRFEFFKKRWFLEPSLVCNYWPINTNFPESFKEIESEWPNYFLFEPGLHFGFKF